MEISIPKFSLVFLMGVSSSGKSTFAAKHFLPSEVVSSDRCRVLVSDEELNPDSTQDAFDLLHFIVAKRLKRGKLTVVDATNIAPNSRKSLLALAKKYHTLSAVIAFEVDEELIKERNEARTDRDLPNHALRNQRMNMRKSLRMLKKEGFRFIYRLNSPEVIEAATIRRARMWTDRTDDHGPFDIIGDVHGCFDELRELLETMGYTVTDAGPNSTLYGYLVTPPKGRRVIFLGDLVDRGPKVVECLKLAMSMVETGAALIVPGNHETKLLRKLKGKNVKLRHGLAETMEQLDKEPEAFHDALREFIYKMISHLVLDDGKLVVAHAGLREDMQGRASGAVRSFCLYGETTGETDEFGLPVRYNWAKDYRGKAAVVYGHTPVPEAEWLNNTIDIDTGCVFGGKLTGLRYPEMEIVSIPAKEEYCVPAKPLDHGHEAPEQDDVLDIEDVTGFRLIETGLRSKVPIREENSIAALEVMSRFAIDPRWLIHLPPTMSPVETSPLDGYLEHPAEAFSYYKKQGVTEVICEEKHMGSRAVMIVCRNKTVAEKRFGIHNGENGALFTRTGRAFFKDKNLETGMISRVRTAFGKSGMWKELSTDWVILDCELMPWSAKAQALLVDQYASVGAAATASLPQITAALELAAKRGIDTTELAGQYAEKETAIENYVKAYRQYCWAVDSLDDFKLAPFHILASEGAVHADKDHLWHMDTIAKVCAADPKLMLATPYLRVDLRDDEAIAKATQWWLDLTAKGGEGMVVKSLNFAVKNKRKLVQPAVKVRGKEYLRIIYGPEYDRKENLTRLKKRNLRSKRNLATAEFALGMESLERFVLGKSLRSVHECVFGVLALESEAVDPRL